MPTARLQLQFQLQAQSQLQLHYTVHKAILFCLHDATTTFTITIAAANTLRKTIPHSVHHTTTATVHCTTLTTTTTFYTAPLYTTQR